MSVIVVIALVLAAVAVNTSGVVGELAERFVRRFGRPAPIDDPGPGSRFDPQPRPFDQEAHHGR